MKKKQLNAIGNEVQKASDKWLKTSLKIWNNYPDDLKGIISAAFNDSRDMYTVGALIKVGEVKKAYKLADSLDTIIRDYIPSIAWQLMETEVYGRNKSIWD
jgi:hypothetical protein